MTRIVKLQAENIKRLRAVEITPDGNIVRITGRNGQGKSSVLDAIAYALGGQSLVPSKPIREGEKKARAIVTLDNGLTVERRFTEKGTVLEVKREDGAKYGSPQAMIDQMLGESHSIANPLMLHIPTADHFVGPDAQKAMHDGLDSNPHCTLHDYEGLDHGFATTEGDRRNDEGANLADGRTAAFFQQHLG